MPVTRPGTPLTALPRTLAGAVDCLQAEPDATILAGGTDVMVEVNAGRRTAGPVVSLRRVPELRDWWREGDDVVLGCCLTFATAEAKPLAGLLPGLAQAARTVGSPQIRSAATVGGNVCTASPAGDSLPVLAALGARVRLLSPAGPRTLPLLDFVTGVKRTALQRAELVTALQVPVLSGAQEFLKVGPRGAMVIAVASLALAVDPARRRVGIGLGAVAPVPVRPADAERRIEAEVDWGTGRLRRREAAAELAQHVATAAAPIDDHRSTADYRRHVVTVCAQRALERALG